MYGSTLHTPSTASASRPPILSSNSYTGGSYTSSLGYSDFELQPVRSATSDGGFSVNSTSATGGTGANMSTAASFIPGVPSPARLRSSIIRIPIASKLILALMGVAYVASWSFSLDWLTLVPDKVFGGGAHRLSSFPFIHAGFFHALLNILALAPLIDRFEAENGTLVTLLLFFGPFATLPGLLYTLTSLLFHIHSPVLGASVWVFLLLTAQLYRVAQTTPYISIPIPSLQSSSNSSTPAAATGSATNPTPPYSIPTAVVPILLILLTSLLMPHSSLLGHTCGALIGAGWASGWLKFLAPPEKILRWVEEKGRLRQRLPASYASVDKVSMGRFGAGVLPTREGGAAFAMA